MKPVFPIPSRETLFDFILQSNHIDREELSLADIQSTFNKQAQAPLAAGHISAIKLVIDLAKQEDFPVRHPVQFQNPHKSDTNLHWLRDLHHKLMTPAAVYGQEFMVSGAIKPDDCGNYRLHPKMLGLNRVLPKPHLIQPLLHLWYTDLANFHLNIRAVLHKPSHQNLCDIEQAAQKYHHQLMCIAPWTKGNGRSARLLENALRLRWGLPWKTIQSRDAQQYVDNLMAYENGEEWQTILREVAKKS